MIVDYKFAVVCSYSLLFETKDEAEKYIAARQEKLPDIPFAIFEGELTANYQDDDPDDLEVA